MGIIDEINNLRPQISSEGSLSGYLRHIIEESLKPKPSSTSHYQITQLTNPAETYFSRIHPEVTIPPELGRKFAWGKHLQNTASYWFNNISDFIVGEETLDGKWVGIDKVRGRFDYLIKDSIIEFKTKEVNPLDINEVYSFFPMDLEQLVFYSIIHPVNPKINYLVFMEDNGKFNLKAFRVKINNFHLAKRVLLSRISMLDDAFISNNPSALGRCRYYNSGCKFTGTNKCNCHEFSPLDISDLKKAITIIYDDTFTQQLEQARKSSQEKDVFCLTIYNLIAPRKHYIQNILGYDPGFYSDTLTDEYKSCLTIGVNKLKDTLNIFLNQEQRSIIKNSKEDHRILIGFRWLNYKQSGKGDQQIPYIIKVGKTSSKRYMRASPYHIAELGIICGLYKKTNGLIFIVYPNLNNLIMTYKVDFKRQRELSRIVKKNVDNIENSEKNKDVSLLPLCEKFQCPVYKGESCPLEHECFHS